MRCKHIRHVLQIALLVLLIGSSIPGTGWAQQAYPPVPASAPAPADDSPGLTAMAAVAGLAGSLFYIPFKLAAICPAMALASGGSLAVTGGDTGTAGYLLRSGCGGTYFITPGMVRGQVEFHGAGER